MNQRRISMIAAPATALAVAVVVPATSPATASGAAGGLNAPGSADIMAVQDETEPISVDDLRQLVAQFEATGEVTFSGARRLGILLVFVEHHIDRGTPAGAIATLEEFKEIASDPRYVPSEPARVQLIAAADQLIAHLSDGSSP
jgi:hypothetical protein